MSERAPLRSAGTRDLAGVGSNQRSIQVDRSPATPHYAPTTVDELLAAARARLERLTPVEAYTAMREGAALVDIRSDRQRACDGVIPGAVFVPRNVLEWRLDVACAHADQRLARGQDPLVLICDEGYQSSLAAATIQRFGQRTVTDVVGGFQAWRATGLPVQAARLEPVAP
jgi:rhodanese-related sulfurtransferase